MIHCSCLIAGGSMTACGFAAAHPGSLLAEESFVPGWDFISALPPIREFDPVVHPEAKRFREEFFARNGVDEQGSLRHAALYPELAAWLLEKKVDLRLGTTVIPGKAEHVFRLISSSGEEEIFCESFHDFRFLRKETILFHALIAFPEGKTVTGIFDRFTLDRCAVEDCVIFTMTFHGSVTMDQARKELRTVWAERPETLKDGRIAWSAEMLDPALFPDPFSALDAGLRKEAF